MRLFVALPVDDRVRAHLAQAVAPLRARFADAAWTRPEGWHITLAFLGEVTEPDMVEVVAASALSDTGTGPVRLRLAAPGDFGGRVLHVGVADEPASAVARCGAVLQERLAEAGLPVDRRPVRPHLTLARARRGRLPRGLVAAAGDVLAAEDRARPGAPAELAWTVAEARLVRSLLGDGPARYETVASLPL